MAKTREQLEIEQRKRQAALRKKEKEDFKKERERLRMELARDKAERAARGGKLQSRLGVEGYKPDGIQYDKEEEGDAAGGNDAEHVSRPKKSIALGVAKMDEYIAKVASYRAGGDGERCLQTLKLYITNPIEKPDEAKFRSIKMDNKAFKSRIKPFFGAKQLLMACGFQPNEQGTSLILPNDFPVEILVQAKNKLEKALQSIN